MKSDSSYFEGNPIGKPQSRIGLSRIGTFLGQRKRQLGNAVILIILSIGLELAMPFITKFAIDAYLLPYSLRLDSQKATSEELRIITEALPEERILRHQHYWYIQEKDWQSLDPSLTSHLRQTHILESSQWYIAEYDPDLDNEPIQYTRQLKRVDDKVLITREALSHLDKKTLYLLRKDDAYGLIIMAVLFSVAAILSLTVYYYQTVILEKTGQEMVLAFRKDVFNHILNRSLQFFGDHPIGKLVTRINNDTEAIGDLFRNMLVGLCRDVFLFFGIAIVIFALDALLATYCMIVAPVMLTIAYFFARISKTIFLQIKGLVGSINTLLQESIAGHAAIKAIGAEFALLEKLVNVNVKHYRAGIAQVRLNAVFTPLMELLGSLSVALIIWYGGGAVIQDRLSLGTLVAFISYIQMLLIPVRDLSDRFNQLQGAIASIERISSLLDDKSVLPQPVPAKEFIRQTRESGIQFSDVRFGYQADSIIYNGLNLFIPNGQKIVLVGSSGGGKSTLANLILRLYDPVSGTIHFNGQDIKTIPGNVLSKKIALVSQENILISGSIEENIVLNRPDISVDMIGNAVEISGAINWIDELADGLLTRIGDGGRKLSQGQYQMLALARALAGDPEVLILDEAFSQIDPESEHMIMSRLPRIMANRTCIIIAHRLSTALHADRILLIRDGAIEEDGDHQSLLQANGCYAHMVKLASIV